MTNPRLDRSAVSSSPIAASLARCAGAVNRTEGRSRAISDSSSGGENAGKSKFAAPAQGEMKAVKAQEVGVGRRGENDVVGREPILGGGQARIAERHLIGERHRLRAGARPRREQQQEGVGRDRADVARKAAISQQQLENETAPATGSPRAMT